MLPCTTKRRITINLESINNQKFQKIKLHGTLITQELKKQSTRPTRAVRQADEPTARWRKVQAGLAEWETETQSRQWTMAGVAKKGETTSLTPVRWKVGLELSR